MGSPHGRFEMESALLLMDGNRASSALDRVRRGDAEQGVRLADFGVQGFIGLSAAQSMMKLFAEPLDESERTT